MHNLFIVLIFLAAQAYASPLQIGTRALFINPNAQGFVTVTNSADSTQYFRARAERIDVDTEGKVSKVTAKNPKDLGLMVAPVNIKLSAKQKRKIRVVSMANQRGGAAIAKGEHKYYKITFDHLTQERAEREKLLAEGQSESKTQKAAVYAYIIIEKSLMVDVGFNRDRDPKTFAKVREIVQPAETEEAPEQGKSPVQSAETEKVPEQGKSPAKKRTVVEIKNTGNVALFVTQFEECDASGKCGNKGWLKQLFPQEQYVVGVADNTTSVRYVEKSAEHKVDRFLAVRK